MSGFYVSLIFLGSLLVIVCLVLIFMDKKSVSRFWKNIDQKKNELAEVVNDAEQMIDELNRLSDYIVNQMEIKNEELNKNIEAAEKRINDLKEKAASICTQPMKTEKNRNRNNGGNKQKNHKQAPAAGSNTPELTGVQDTDRAGTPSVVSTAQAAVTAYKSNEKPSSEKQKEKVIPFSNRYAEVLRLSKQGMNEVDIAKNLNMGKGEVELIIGLRK